MDSEQINKINTNILQSKSYKFTSDVPLSWKLSDLVVIYNSGTKWKIVLVNIMLSYPIINDFYIFNDKESFLSVLLCPITLQTVAINGLCIFDSYKDYNLIIKNKETNALFKINQISKNRRSEVKIMTLRDALILVPDGLFIQTKIKLNPIINSDYYSNYLDFNNKEIDKSSIHPKTLVHIIQYKSYKTQKDKISIVVGKDANEIEPSGYNLRSSNVLTYISKYQQKIINREGFVIPILWYIAKILYKESRIVFTI